MKKNIYIALAVAMMGFTACSEDSDYLFVCRKWDRT